MVKRFRVGPLEALKVGRFNLGVNSSFVVYRVEGTWIDCGPANQWHYVKSFALEKSVERVLLTHHHEDHSGNARRLQAQMGAQILAPQLSLELLRDGFPLQFYRRIVWGAPPKVEAQPLPDFFEDSNGCWCQIHTPGHSHDMVCLFEKRRGWLFSADLYVASRVRYGRDEDHVEEEIQSLQRALQLPFEDLFCSHRGHVPDGRRALQAKLSYLCSLKEQVLELHGQGLPLGQIQQRLLGSEDFVSWVTGFHFCKRKLIRACLPREK